MSENVAAQIKALQEKRLALWNKVAEEEYPRELTEAEKLELFAIDRQIAALKS